MFKLSLIIICFIILVFSDSLQAKTTQDTVAIAGTVAPEDGIPVDQVIIDAGQTLFKNNCAVCHSLQDVIIGPPLAGVYERLSFEWISSFVRNSQQVIQSGDEYAVGIYNQYNKTEMTSFDFSDEEILSILAFIKYETLNPPQLEVAIAADGGEISSEVTSTLLSQKYLVVILVGLVIILILLFTVLLLLLTTLTKYLKQKEGLTEAEAEVLAYRFDVKAMMRSPAFVAGVTFLFLAIFTKTIIDSLYLVGVQQGYAPTQPIVYSHKVHAGDFAIECQYCHTGVADSKNANIPSANICMNCHSGIIKVTDSDEISEEIMKIYDAVETGTPIEWVRVHNLPDLAFFSHAQHYNVGGVECQDCHGVVEEMEVVSQFADLTMGWCIDCHRTTEIKADNAYYDQLVALHEGTSNKPMMVEDIGGLECSKCHY
ncbi:c-type cytochrome [Bacteroidota bacterium]